MFNAIFKKKSQKKPITTKTAEEFLASDRGARQPQGKTKMIILVTAILWAVFQLYYSSPLPYWLQGLLHNWNITLFNVVVDDTRARSIHLAFALFLAYLSFPAFSSSPKNKVPLVDWVFAVVAAFLASYYLFFYDGILQRVGAPNLQDILAGSLGILLLLEAARRSLGLPLVVIASLFLTYNFVGEFFPTSWIVSHRSGSISHIINQQWITTEGIFGIPLGVSTKYVFLFVLFGALLDKAGAGNYFIKTAFAYLGHFRGGPAKASVVASGLTGLISGSSIANVITTGTFTIPLMKRVGFSKEKAGAIEVSCSVDGQIMPPIMGAAAFIMIEYVGMPYNQLIVHAFLPAIISYFALFYVVHLEAYKNNLQGLEKAANPSPWLIRLMSALGTFIFLTILYFAVKFGLGWIKIYAPHFAFLFVAILLAVAYLLLIYRASTFPDLEVDDPNAPVTKLAAVKPTLNSGLHYLVPVVVLIWSLMIERLSPSLSAFWAIMALLIILLSQNFLLAYFRKEKMNTMLFLKKGMSDLQDGLERGSRNMISVGIATATAGIIVGVVALTGFGAQLSNIIEILSLGNIVLMLLLVALFSLILGMGLPTTANYIVVSSLLALVIVDVGAQSGLVVPLVAAHLFVFYFGIMADVTPPVGLAAFASSAISGGDPIKTGVTAFFYSLRTAILPFLFVFNTDILLIDVTFFQGVLVFVIATIGILTFTSATMGYFFRKNRWWEAIALLVITFALFRPGFFMHYVSPEYQSITPAHFSEQLVQLKPNDVLKLHVSGLDEYGKHRKFYTELRIPPIEAHEKKEELLLEKLGLTLLPTDETIKVKGKEIQKILIDNVAIGSIAHKAGLDWDQAILEVGFPVHDAWAKELIFIPALFFLLLLAAYQHKTKKT